MSQPRSNHDVVSDTLKEMGLGTAPTFHTILLREQRFVGHKYHFDGGYAVWPGETNVIDVFYNDGRLLKTVSVEVPEEKTAVA